MLVKVPTQSIYPTNQARSEINYTRSYLDIEVRTKRVDLRDQVGSEILDGEGGLKNLGEVFALHTLRFERRASNCVDVCKYNQ